MSTGVESLFATSDPHATVADAMNQLKNLIDKVLSESVANVYERHGQDALWTIEPCGHSILHLPGTASSPDTYIATAVILISFAKSNFA